jgi:hypothetical protein
MSATITSPILPKLQRHDIGNMEDMIGELPEAVLLHILSLLPTKDAVRTSILATKWKYLWTHLSVFDFQVYCNSDVSKPEQKSENCLIDQVDKLLHTSNHVERLCIQVQQADIDGEKANSLLSSALMHKLLDLKLSLDHTFAKFVLPNNFSASQSLNKLCLEFGFSLYIPDGIRFPNLKTLYLSHLSFVNEKSAQRLLSGCPVLQELTLYKFIWLNIEQINVAISTLRKLTIDLNHFDPSDLRIRSFTIKFDVANLLSLSYAAHPIIKFVLVNPTSIVDACIDLRCYGPQNQQQNTTQFAIELLSRLGSVKSLTISNDTLQVCFTAHL